MLAPPVKRGVVPESGGTWLLPRLIGWHKACEVTLMARRLDATEIERLGLVNKVVPHETLTKEVRAWAEELASNAPLAVAAAKRSMRLGLEESFEANGFHVMAELSAAVPQRRLPRRRVLLRGEARAPLQRTLACLACSAAGLTVFELDGKALEVEGEALAQGIALDPEVAFRS